MTRHNGWGGGRNIWPVLSSILNPPWRLDRPSARVELDPSKPYTITQAPRVIKGRVVIGNSGSEYGVRGYISAYDAETGELAWRSRARRPCAASGI
jgi:outer membrane protein assembly factor BamB